MPLPAPCLDRREPQALQCNAGVAPGVNTPVKEVEQPAPPSPHDGLVREAARTQFVEVEHSPLVGGQSGGPLSGESFDCRFP